MSFATAVLTLVLLAVVMAVVSRPLLLARKHEEPDAPKRSELEAEREAKYREIRDAELDYRTGKLSREDYEAVNGALRAEALKILNKLEPSGDGRAAGGSRAGEDGRAASGEGGGVADGRAATEDGRAATDDGRAATEDEWAAKEDQATDPAK